MDSRFTPFILIELPQRQARRTKIILGTLFLLICVLVSLAIASKAAASPMETGKPNTSQTKEIQTRATPEQATPEQATPGQATQAQKTAAPHSTTVITQGISLVKAGKFGDAYSVLHPLADSGNAGAQYLVGIILAKGGSILPDDVLDNANININTSTDNGASSGPAGSEDDRKAAMAALAHAYFKRAAQQGHIGAAFELAFQFERGIGTNTDLKRARLLYKVAARQNHLNAQYNLAILLAAGSGGKADFKQAYMWVLAAHSNALKTSHTVLTPQRVNQLAQKIRTRIRYHDAVKARRGAIRLTGFAV
ncbi:MAG: sel1 repeat family protein [Alphaproteobacteria bacterium]|nr:sel1 repeat family protein [Alphaproteobacteria bacterium]